MFCTVGVIFSSNSIRKSPREIMFGGLHRKYDNFVHLNAKRRNDYWARARCVICYCHEGGGVYNVFIKGKMIRMKHIRLFKQTFPGMSNFDAETFSTGTIDNVSFIMKQETHGGDTFFFSFSKQFWTITASIWSYLCSSRSEHIQWIGQNIYPSWIRIGWRQAQLWVRSKCP